MARRDRASKEKAGDKRPTSAAEGINLRDRIEMIGTGKLPTHPEGVPFTCHPKMGEHFERQGIATMSS